MGRLNKRIALKWVPENRNEVIITIGGSITTVLHEAQMRHGITFLNRFRDNDRWGEIGLDDYNFEPYPGNDSNENANYALRVERANYVSTEVENFGDSTDV